MAGDESTETADRESELIPLAIASSSSAPAVEQSPRENTVADQVVPPAASSCKMLFEGTLLMGVVALLWGLNPVCTRALFLSADPPSPFVVCGVQTVVAFITCGSLHLVAQIWHKVTKSTPLDHTITSPEHGDGTGLAGSELREDPVQREQSSDAGPAAILRRPILPSWDSVLHVPIGVPRTVSYPVSVLCKMSLPTMHACMPYTCTYLVGLRKWNGL
jgi:hypothetical protein